MRLRLRFSPLDSRVASFGLVLAAARGWATAAPSPVTRVGSRRCSEELAQRSVADFDAFYSVPVQVTRIAYRARGQANLHPADGGLNLPADRYSHGLRRLGVGNRRDPRLPFGA